MLQPLWSDFSYKAHQVTGIEWMLLQEEDDSFLRGGFLCDEMGLGKTIEVLGLVKNSPRKRTLLFAPLAVLKQWEQAAKNSKLNVFIIDRKTWKWQAVSALKPSRPSFYILNYESGIRHTNLTDMFLWDRVVFDEAHRLSSMKSKIHQSMAKISATCRWAITATPIVNGLGDAKSLFHILGMHEDDLPGTMESMKPLIQKKAICRRVDELRETLFELPKEETTHIHTLPFESQEERDFYRSIQGKLVERLNVLMEEGSDQWAILKLLLLLRQLSVHPQVYINARKRESTYYRRDDWKGDSTKFSALKNLIDQQSSEQHRWIIFSQFHDEMDLLAAALRQLPRIRRVQIYSGKQTQDERDEIIQRTYDPLTNEKTTEVLLVQLQSGSVGLNLQHFDRIAFMSPWWTAALMDQAVGRAVRIGQEKQVQVHHFRLEEEQSLNIDKIMIDKVEMKRELCDWFLENATRGISCE